MRLYSSALAALAMLTVVSADRKFKPADHAHRGGPMNGTTGKDHHTRAWSQANFGDRGAKMDLCPGGDCDKGQFIRLVLSRLEEVDANGVATTNKAENLSALNVTWSDLTNTQVNGVNASMTSFITELQIGPSGSATNVTVNITAHIFSGNGSAKNGDITVPVPAGALKFTLSLSKWPFLSAQNQLRFGVNLKPKHKGGHEPNGSGFRLGKRNKTQSIDRLDMGEGIFMDSPTTASLDNIDTAIKTNFSLSPAGPEYIWIFPKYEKTLLYDPVVGSEDQTAVSGDATVSSPSSGDGKSASATLSLSSAAAMGAAAIAYILF